MLRRHDRDRRLRHVDAEADQLLVDRREMVAHEVRAHMADVEMDVIQAIPLDLGIDRARDDIARRQFHPRWVIFRHEALAGGGVDQLPALAAHRLGDQEVLDLEIVQAGRVELHHFHIGDAAARAPCHRDAVAGRAARRGGKQVGAPRAPGRQDRRARGVQFDPPARAVDGVDAPHIARAGIACLVPAGGEVDRDHVRDHGDIGMCGGGILQRLLHGPAGGVVDMHDAAVRMPALARQMADIPLHVEGHAEFGQPLDRAGCILDDEFHRGTVVQPGAGDHRILDMAVEGVAGFQHGGDPALRPGGRSFVQLPLGQHCHLEAIGQVERGGQPGGA